MRNIFEKLKNFFSIFIFKKVNSTSNSIQKNWIDYGNGVKIRTLNSKSALLERSRELQKQSVYSEILLPYDMEKEFIEEELKNKPLYYSDYDYVVSFQKKNSLGLAGIPLCASKLNTDIQNTRALWCSQEQCWFWPFDEELYVAEMHQFLPKIYNLMLDTPPSISKFNSRATLGAEFKKVSSTKGLEFSKKTHLRKSR